MAPETKTRKMYEVERHENRSRNGRRVFSAFMPGAGQLLRGRTSWGILLLIAWFAALVAWRPALLAPLDRLAGLNLGLDLLGIENVPAVYTPDPLSLIALLAALIIWILGNAWQWKRREA